MIVHNARPLLFAGAVEVEDETGFAGEFEGKTVGGTEMGMPVGEGDVTIGVEVGGLLLQRIGQAGRTN